MADWHIGRLGWASSGKWRGVRSEWSTWPTSRHGPCVSSPRHRYGAHGQHAMLFAGQPLRVCYSSPGRPALAAAFALAVVAHRAGVFVWGK